MTTNTTDALRRYNTAIANAETIGADGWRTLACDLANAADALETAGTSVERQRQFRDRATDCRARAQRAESRRRAA